MSASYVLLLMSVVYVAPHMSERWAKFWSFMSLVLGVVAFFLERQQ